MLNGLDLFSGIGGITIALSPWVRPVAYCEADRYVQANLLSRIGNGDLPSAPIWDDVRTLQSSQLPRIDIIYGGFPCQDISVAGTGKGLDGERSGLFFEIVRLTRDCRPRFVFLENVPAITCNGLDRVLLELIALRYDCRWTIVSAAEMGATHLRERWFLLAHANGEYRGDKWETMESDNRKMGNASQVGNGCAITPNGNGNGLEAGNKRNAIGVSVPPSNGLAGFVAWTSERPSQPRVDRTGDGIQNRLDRTKSLGNAVVPCQAREAFQRLMGL